MRRVLELVDSDEELRSLLDDPSRLLEQMASEAGPEAKRVAIDVLCERLSQHAPEHALGPDVRAAMEATSLEDLHAIIAGPLDPKELLDQLAAHSGAAGKALLLAKLRKELARKVSQRLGISFEDVEAAAALLDEAALKAKYDELRKAEQDANAPEDVSDIIEEQERKRRKKLDAAKEKRASNYKF